MPIPGFNGMGRPIGVRHSIPFGERHNCCFLGEMTNPAAKVVGKMLTLKVRRLFVVDDAGVLVGVISAFDVLRGLGRPSWAAG